MRRRFFNNKIGEKIDLSKPYFAIEALENGLTVKLSINACEYCVDNGEWKTLSKATNTTIINKGQTLSFRGNLTPKSSGGIGTFTILKKCNVKGNVMSLLYKDEFEEQTDLIKKNYVFYKLFYKCTNIVNASELILPATTLADCCYDSMFYGCSSLVSAPELPATTLANYCYNRMFYDCSSLRKAPTLPATKLADCCYDSMFSECTSLTTAPELPATELNLYCYRLMFSWCRSLVTAPELPATTLASGCYSNMFSYCTSLVTAPDLPAVGLAERCYNYMFANCTSLVSAPELPATTLANYCYAGMFSNCTKLNYIKALFTTTPGISYTSDWVFGVSSTGTFVKNKNATWDVNGVHGIPKGWTVEIDGGSTSNLISFTIDGVLYQAEEGMTWEEWCESEYNTIQIVARNTGSDTKVVGLNPPFSILIFKGTNVFGHDLIITGGIYIQQYSDF